MGKASRDKGARGERGVVAVMQSHGLGASRVPLSGASGGKWAGDIDCPVLGRERRFECKSRADGFKEIYGFLADNYGLTLKADRKPFLAVIRLNDLCELIEAADKWRSAQSVMNAPFLLPAEDK